MRRVEGHLMANPVVLADGSPVPMLELDPVRNLTALCVLAKQRAEGQRVRMHEWKVQDAELRLPRNQRLRGNKRLVLFHYVTRSQSDYMTRKLRLYEAEAKRLGKGFSNSLFGSSDTGSKAAGWFASINEVMSVRGGICESAVAAHYAHRAASVAQSVRARHAATTQG